MQALADNKYLVYPERSYINVNLCEGHQVSPIWTQVAFIKVKRLKKHFKFSLAQALQLAFPALMKNTLQLFHCLNCAMILSCQQLSYFYRRLYKRVKEHCLIMELGPSAPHAERILNSIIS